MIVGGGVRTIDYAMPRFVVFYHSVYKSPLGQSAQTTVVDKDINSNLTRTIFIREVGM